MCARTCACARARVADVGERLESAEEGSAGVSARPPGPVRGPVWPPPAAHGGRWLSSGSRSPPSPPAAAFAAPQRPAGCPSFPSGWLFRSVSGGGVVRVRSPVGGERGERASASSASRRPPAVAPGRARAGRSRRRARGRDRACRRAVAAAVLSHASPPPIPTPVRVPSYRVPARRFKDPRGGSLSVPGVGGGGGARRESSSWSFGGSLGLPFLAWAAVSRGTPRSGSGSPLLGARGARPRVPGSPARGRLRAPCLVGLGFPASPPDPLPVLCLFFSFVSLAGPRRAPLRCPRRLSGGGGRGGGTVPPSARCHPEKLVRLLAVDHSARASMKNAASCEN